MIRRRGANPFHPELRRAARFLPRTVFTPLTVKLFRVLPRPRATATGSDLRVVTLGSGVEVRVHRPVDGVSQAGPALLWIHGGGYVLGNAAMDDGLCRRLARELGATVAAVDYRLAPEHPYPTPLHDCYDALRWLTEAPSVDARRVAVAGASAGGGLAAAVAQLAHDRSE